MQERLFEEDIHTTVEPYPTNLASSKEDQLWRLFHKVLGKGGSPQQNPNLIRSRLRDLRARSSRSSSFSET
ncbi:hypothetical protein NECAME_02191 [Necator americanus]|uniref:Uncharacterized protein n=1 Tax=Necator americanus TaxID=51031 RepID=W2THS8_NECAM|nr:hypothetical protein NECAME_02191 [Necator americanus]ETN81149.1 hypothetical protein NECAME_02191 [Necator americanus]